jgi:hypothetical protein
MGLEELTKGVVKKVKDVTIGYQASSYNLEKNKTRALFGVAALGALYLVPGDQPLLSTITVGYTVLKSYHSVRDWAGK